MAYIKLIKIHLIIQLHQIVKAVMTIVRGSKTQDMQVGGIDTGLGFCARLMAHISGRSRSSQKLSFGVRSGMGPNILSGLRVLLVYNFTLTRLFGARNCGVWE